MFSKGGFDCLLGNPPWEKINFADEEFFISRSPEIANARNKAERKALMAELPKTNPALHLEYINTKRWNDCLSIFFRSSGAYPLTGVSRVNLYSVFAERYQGLINKNGATGNVLPTGIVVDNNNKDLYFHLLEEGKLDRVIDYENKKGIFPDVHRMYRFCLFITVGKNGRNEYKFYQSEPSQNNDFIIINEKDIIAINPNTRTCPSFKSPFDFELAKKAYSKWGVLENEIEPDKSSWNIRVRTPFNMSNDSGLFQDFSENLLPLYEAKYIYHYNHRYCTYEGGTTVNSTDLLLSNPNFRAKTQYYLSQQDLISRFGDSKYFLTYRMITNATNERTMIASIIPAYPCGNSLSIIECENLRSSLFLLANLNSIVFDYFVRQKVGGTNFNHWILKQLPAICYSKIPDKIVEEIVRRAFELTYTTEEYFKEQREYKFIWAPFQWDQKRRSFLQIELDVIFGQLYGLTSEEFEVILEDFPVLQRKEISKYGSYRTKDQILSEFDRFNWISNEMKNKIIQQ